MYIINYKMINHKDSNIGKVLMMDGEKLDLVLKLNKFHIVEILIDVIYLHLTN